MRQSTGWKKDAFFSVRIPQAMRDRLEAAAAKNERTAAAEIRVAIAKHLDESEASA